MSRIFGQLQIWNGKANCRKRGKDEWKPWMITWRCPTVWKLLKIKTRADLCFLVQICQVALFVAKNNRKCSGKCKGRKKGVAWSCVGRMDRKSWAKRSGRRFRIVQTENSTKPSLIISKAFTKRRNQHESVLRVSSFEKWLNSIRIFWERESLPHQ